MERARVTTHIGRGDERSSEVTASSASLGKESKSRPNRREVERHPAFSQTQMPSAVVRQTSLEQKQHLWRCS